MAFTRPTLDTIVKRIKADFKTGLNLQAILIRSFLDIFAKAFGGASHTLHGHIDFGINKKFFPDGANPDEATVVRWGTLFNVIRNDANFAELTMEFTGTTGGTVLDQAILVRSDGVLYTLQVEAVVPAAGTIQANVVCQTEGEIGNLADGEFLTLQSSVPGVSSSVEVITTIIEGEDQESLIDYQTRVIERMQDPPAGGKVTDYVSFGKTVTGVTRVWVLPDHLGEGTVGLTFVEDGNIPASIIPSPAKVTEVQEAVEALKPISADLFVFVPIELEMNPEIQLKPNTTDVQNAVISELDDLLAREAQVRDASDPDQVGVGVQFDGKIKISQINEAISIAAGEEDHILISPTADVQPQTGGLVTLGTPIFSTLP